MPNDLENRGGRKDDRRDVGERDKSCGGEAKTQQREEERDVTCDCARDNARHTLL